MKKNILTVLLLTVALITSACTSAKNSVAQVGDSYITKSEFEYYLSNIKLQMEGTELSSEEDWQTKEIEGKKAIDLAKEKSFDTAVDNLQYIEVGKKVLELTSEDEQNIVNLKNTIVNKQCGGESKYKEYIKKIGVSDGFIDMLCKSEIYRAKLLEKVENESNIDDEMLKNTFNEKYRRAKHILFLTKDMTTGLDLSEETVKAAKEKAESVLQRVQSGEDFDSLAAEFTEDPGLQSNPDGYVFTDGEMVSEFEDGVDKLGNGQVSLIESSYGYHIIKRLPLDESEELYTKFFESKKENVKTEILNDILQEKIEDWNKEYNIKVVKNDEIYNSIK